MSSLPNLLKQLKEKPSMHAKKHPNKSGHTLSAHLVRGDETARQQQFELIKTHIEACYAQYVDEYSRAGYDYDHLPKIPILRREEQSAVIQLVNAKEGRLYKHYLSEKMPDLVVTSAKSNPPHLY